MLSIKKNVFFPKLSEAKKQSAFFLIWALTALLLPLGLRAATGFDTLRFKPANDQGFYLTVEQSQTLGQWGRAIGVTGDFSSNSLVLKNGSGVRIQDVIQKQLSLDLGASLGLTDWLNIGIDVGGVPFQQFVTPGTLVQDNGGRMGDMLLNFKARLLNNENFPVGIALVPFITFPTGNESHFVGNGKITGGAKLVVDTRRIADRVSFAINAGGQARDSVTLNPGVATIGHQFLYGAAVNVEIAKPVQLVAEVNGWTPFSDFFKSQNRNLQLDGGLRILPGEKRRVSMTIGGGAGLQKQAGVPDWHAFTTLAYRFPKKEVSSPPQMAVTPPVKEEVITTNEIHFAFNKAVIRPESYRVIDEILNSIRGRSEVESIRVEGHTDSVGSDLYNEELSERRANAVRVFLIGRGYPSDKIVAIGRGESSPVDDNTTKAGRAQNRRVEFHLQIQTGAHISIQKKDESSPTFEDGDRERRVK